MQVLREPWRPHPLAWIHRAEAAAVAAELGAGLEVFRKGVRYAAPLLRLSDPVMLEAARALDGTSYIGPGAAALARCYDKREACRLAAAAGVDCPAPANGRDPAIVKPRRGSDSLGMLWLRDGRIPLRYRSDDWLAQEQVIGEELTVAVLHGQAGQPLRFELPEGRPYTFARKYLGRTRRSPLPAGALAERVRAMALRIAGMLGVDWAARVDLIHVPRSGRVCFLECDAAPLIGIRSAFAQSLAAGGLARAAQWPLLLDRRKP